MSSTVRTGREGRVGILRTVVVRRWSVVAAILALCIAVPATVAAWPVSPAAIPAPAELRDRITASDGVAWSGYAETSGGLGLPRIGALSDVTSLLSGSTRLRAWYVAPDRQRVDQLQVSGERDRYTTPDGDVVWDYGAELATVVGDDPEVRLPRPDDLLPPQLARRLLSGTAPGDAASALPARRFAGIDAPGVRVTVADPRTTVGAVDVWADPASGLPLAVEVVARGAAGPAVTTRFAELTVGPPDPAALVPRRGPGSGFTRSPTSDLFGVIGRGSPTLVPATVDGVARERPQRRFAAIGQYGTTLAQVIVVPLAPDLARSLLSGVSQAGRGIAVGGARPAQGGLLESPLLNLAVVRAGDRAWAIGGLVTPEVLERAASDVAGSVRR